MRTLLGFSWICSALLLGSVSAHAAGSSEALVTSSEAMNVSRVSGKEGILDAAVGRSRFSVTDFTMLNGPALNNMDGHIAPGTAPGAGVSLRHVLSTSWRLSDTVTLGPVLDAAQYLYTPSQGAFVFEDPQFRISISDVNRWEIGASTVHADVWLSTFAPVSEQSRFNHMITGLGASYIPHVYFKGSRFGLSGVGSLRLTLIENPGTSSILTPLQLMGGLQGTYHIAQRWGGFLMSYVSASAGPPVCLVDPATGLSLLQKRGGASGPSPLGFMTGLTYRPIPAILVSPRLNWAANQPLQSSTVGLNASFQLI